MTATEPNEGKPRNDRPLQSPPDNVNPAGGQEKGKKDEPLHPERLNREKVEKNVPADRDPDDPVSP